MEEVILVDAQDNQIGTEEKIKAHKDGKLHRAFSVFQLARTIIASEASAFQVSLPWPVEQHFPLIVSW